MPWTWSMRLQTAVVMVLFLGSLATVLFSTFQTLILPQREYEVRDRLREASQRLADAAAPELGRWQAEDARLFEPLNERLRTIASRVLADFPGVEGGFYLDAGFDRFAGHGFPTDHPPLPPAARHPSGIKCKSCSRRKSSAHPAALER